MLASIFIPEFALSVLSGDKDFGSDRPVMDQGPLVQLLGAQVIWGACGNPASPAITFLQGIPLCY